MAKKASNTALTRALISLKQGGPEWRKVYARYRATVHWKTLRALKLSRQPWCAMCRNWATEVHHRRYVWFNEDADKDLTAVCKKCHMRAHGRRR